MLDILDRHQRIALQLSGGKDSLACLQLLRDELHRITVYHLVTTDHDPAIDAGVEWARKITPRFITINSAIPANTVPSDLVPSSATAIGLAARGLVQPVIIDRFSCCYATIMLPLHYRMIADGITLIIRGQKACDKRQGMMRNGAVHEGIEYLLPLEHWSDAQVFDYLDEHEVPLPNSYYELDGGVDCLACSAWWDEKRHDYVKRNYPAHFVTMQQRLDYIRAMLREDLQHLEVRDGHQ